MQLPEGHTMVAVILAAGVTAAIIILSLDVLVYPQHLSETESSLLATALGAAIGAIATYIGLSKSNDENSPK